MNRDIHQLRTEYKSKPLLSTELSSNPMEQFEQWFQEAINQEVAEPNTFSLATSGADGQVSNRMVLVKEISKSGIVFYTNYKSRKGQQIADNPLVSACFFWQPIFKQVRIEGYCKKIPAEQSDAYFNKRPIDSRIGAATSPQSEIIPSRDWLEKQWQENKKKLGETIVRPEFWGGYIILPNRVEFWQGQPSRLHDRFEYKLENERWKVNRLAP